MPIQHACSEALSRIVGTPELLGRSNKEQDQMLDPGLTRAFPASFCTGILPGAGCYPCHSFIIIFKDFFSCMCQSLCTTSVRGYLWSLLCSHHCPTQPTCSFPLPVSWNLTCLMWPLKQQWITFDDFSCPLCVQRVARTGPNLRESHWVQEGSQLMMALVCLLLWVWSQVPPTHSFWTFHALCQHPWCCLPDWNRSKPSLSVTAHYQG